MSIYKNPSWYAECDRFDTYSIKPWITSDELRFARPSPQPSSSGSDQTASPSFTIMRRFSSTTRRTSNCADVILQFAWKMILLMTLGGLLFDAITTQSCLSFVGGSLVRANWQRKTQNGSQSDNFEAILIIETRSVLTYRNMERDFTGGWKVVAKNR